MKNQFVLALGIAALALSSCQTSSSKKSNGAVVTKKADRYAFVSPPKISGESKVELGAFSGLRFTGRNLRTGDLEFVSLTDRGPNLEPMVDSKGNLTLRPFVEPSFVPRVLRLSVDRENSVVRLNSTIEFTLANGKKMSGRPNSLDTDEIPRAVDGTPLVVDPMGIDSESIAVDTDGSFWVADEYRPSILHFNKKGKLISRWVPEGAPKGTGTPTLPKDYLKRGMNRGFEGIAIDSKHVFAVLQSAMSGESSVRILAVNKSNGKKVAEYRYEFDRVAEGGAPLDKIGDLAEVGDGSFLIVEQNSSTGPQSIHRIYRVRFDGADGSVLQKTLIADLNDYGIRDFEKVEGVTVIDPLTIAIANDNDFGLLPAVPMPERTSQSFLVILHLDKALNE